MSFRCYANLGRRLDRNTKDKPKPKARYINNLIKSAEERKKLDFLRKENAAERERKLEGAEYADKEEYVTEAFKTHLEELREFEQREKEEAEQEGKLGCADRSRLSRLLMLSRQPRRSRRLLRLSRQVA